LGWVLIGIVGLIPLGIGLIIFMFIVTFIGEILDLFLKAIKGGDKE
jgi:hypothetical protein